ncbi:hypothetical protein AB0L75_38270 [Streptomyces sp. NPDC052101]|uniref:hypothetical protein n=1 Tax=Streptomyces sp. NPDC052101 TaxID=3155763 RepID=UPI0034140070
MASKSVEDVLFPGIDVRVERVSDSSGVLVVEAVSMARPGQCPGWVRTLKRAMYGRASFELRRTRILNQP